MDTKQQKPAYQFGVFELDTCAGELRKYGVKIKLQQQPLHVLSFLLEHAGEIVTREDIQKELWPEDIYVDFGNAINSSIRKLREALGDSADSPRFIETLPRRGYRFIAPVSHRSSSTAAAPASLTENGFGSFRFREDNYLSRLTVHRRRSWFIALGAAVVAALGAPLGFWFSNSTSGAANPLLSAVPFTSYPGYEVLPSFSPEGTRVAFTWQKPGANFPEVYIKLLGPGQPVRLGGAGGFGPTWSPDGRFVAFLHSIDVLHTAVMVIPAVGGEGREITRIIFDGPPVISRYGWNVPAPFLAWSPDGKWLLTLDQKSPGASHPHAIVRVSVDTGEKRILTAPSGNEGEGGLALSPDGKRLAFTQDSGLWARDIYVVPLSADLLLTGKPRRITFDNKAIAGIVWTKDGRYLIYSSPRNGAPELWKIAPEPGSRPARLGLTDNDVTDIAISRDGKRLVYAHEIDDQNIWRASLDGRGVNEASNFIASTRRDTQVRYSPDGKQLAFESNRSGNEEIWICKADASNPVQLTYFGSAWAGAPSWSPDGKEITFAANAAGNWNIYVVSSGGGNPRRLTNNEADESWPSWSRDGRWIYYFSNRGKQEQIWKMPAGGGPETRVTRNGGLWSSESVDGKDFYYVNEQGLWKIPVAGGGEVKIAHAYIFAPAKNGIYYVDGDALPVSHVPLRFFDSKTKRTRTVGVLSGPLGWDMEVSPDERWIVYAKFDREGSELMAVEDFR